jgi:hypothetical protein
MSELKLTGKIIAIMDKQQVTDTFAKREFVIETDEQYPQMVKFELTQAKCEDIDNHKVGEEITVHFNVRGRKWTNKENKDVYFVSVNAWRLEKGSETPAAADAPFPSADAEPPADSFADDLPF